VAELNQNNKLLTKPIQYTLLDPLSKKMQRSTKDGATIFVKFFPKLDYYHRSSFWKASVLFKIHYTKVLKF